MAKELAGFDDFVAARGPTLYRAAYLLTGDAHDAQDLVQTALLKVVPKWARICADPEPYVRRVLYTEHVSRWRRRRGRDERPRDDVPEVADTRSSLAEHTASRLDLRAALLQLAPKQRAIVVLRHYEDLTEAQTAELLGCSVGTVKRQNHLGLARLRTLAPGLALDPPGVPTP